MGKRLSDSNDFCGKGGCIGRGCGGIIESVVVRMSILLDLAKKGKM